MSDAAVGGYTYLLEIVTGIAGSRCGWRTMPWLVVLFGLMIAPLGIISILFIIIQPIYPRHHHPADRHRHLEHYRVDRRSGDPDADSLLNRRTHRDAPVPAPSREGRPELAAHSAHGRHRRDAGGAGGRPRHRRVRPPARCRDQGRGRGDVSLPWDLALSGLIGLSLLFTRITLGAEGGLANSDHLIGSLVLAMTSLAAAEVARPLRFLNILLGAALFATPFIYGASMTATIASVACGAALVALSIRRGPIRERYGTWTRLIV